MQRIGRAGCRDGNALSVTVATGSPHDLFYYAKPLDMLARGVEPPGVFLNASAVLERQFTAFCLDSWVATGVTQEAVPATMRTVYDAAWGTPTYPVPHGGCPIYWMLSDTGLLTHLIEADATRLRRDRTLLGHVMENFVAMELTKQLGWSERRCKLLHFRTDAGAKVDLVLEDRMGRLVAIEVKCTHALRKRDFRGLETLAELTGQRFVRGVVLYAGAAVVPFGKGLYALPVSQLWA